MLQPRWCYEYKINHYITIIDPHFYVFLGLASIPVVFTLIGCFYMCWGNCRKCRWAKKKSFDYICLILGIRKINFCCSCPKREQRMKEEKNDICGTYSRGSDGEGEYGDGDGVYVLDTNEFYSC